MDFGDPDSVPPGTGTITGRTVNWVAFPPFEELVTASNEPINQPYVALSDLGTDRQVARVRGDADGNFTFNNVPAGLYQLAIWDGPLDYIIRLVTVAVGDGETVNMGDIGVFRWFGWLSGDIFMDTNQNAIRDPGEIGIPNQEVLVRYRDGSIHQGSVADANGRYEFAELRSPLGRFELAEVDFGRFARTGHSVHDEQFSLFNNLDPNPTVISPDVGGGIIVSQMTWEGRRTNLDWGKLPYQGTDNGGISGVVLQATTRNEFDARMAAAEDYEPGIPNVTVQLWGLAPGGDPANGADYTVLLNEVQTDSWQTPRESNPDNPVRCDVRGADGTSLEVPGNTPDFVASNCIEVPMPGNETHPGAYDGGWAFEDMCPPGTYPCNEADLISPLPPGEYVIEVIPPPFYQILKEEDNNTVEGQDLVPAFPPAPCVGPDHVVGADDPVFLANFPDAPFNGLPMPLCNRRLATLQPQQNVGIDIFLFTDSDTDGDATTRTWRSNEAVPPPARFFGLVEDDIVINADPNSISYGEPRGVANVPIGVYEFNRDGMSAVGRRLITVYTDENGYYEVMVPSTYTADCPTPAGVCTQMYILLTDDPGDVNNPDPAYRKDYLTEPFVFEAIPGKMRWTDTPIDPINTLVCSVPPDAPQIFQVSTPVVNAGVATQLTITGMRFGNNPTDPPIVLLDPDAGGPIPEVELPVVTWTPATPFDPTPVFEDVVVVEVPATFPAGPAQLEIISGEITGFIQFPGQGPLSVNSGGRLSRNGMTIHVIGGAYTPPVVTVSPPVNPDTPVIQPAILSAPADALVVIEPGTYRENLIINERIKLQGYGPGGVVGTGRLEGQDFPCPEPNCPPVTLPGEEPFAHIQGSVIDGRHFAFDGTRQGDWQALLGGLTYVGPADVPEGAAITWLAPANNAYNDASYRPQIDGLGITTGRGEASGGVYLHAYDRNMIISKQQYPGIEPGRPWWRALRRPTIGHGWAGR